MARIEVDPSFGFFPWKTFRKIANVGHVSNGAYMIF